MTHAVDEIKTRAIKRKLVETSVCLRPTEVYTLDEELDRHPAHRLVSKRARESILEAGIVLTVRDKRGRPSRSLRQEAQPIIHPSRYQWGGVWDYGGIPLPPLA
jgi:hypothetical protein